MNPRPTAAPAVPRPVVNDITARPAPPSAVPPPTGTLTPNIVNNIPLRDPDAQRQPAPAATEDAKLDKVMQAIGHDLKKIDDKPAKKRFLFFKRQLKSQPRPPTHPQSAASPQPISQNPPPAAQTASKVKPAAAPKPRGSHPVPVFVIFLTVMVTGALIAAAVYSVK